MKKLITFGVSAILFFALIFWHYSVSITERKGEILQQGASGRVYVFEDNNPVFNFKIIYDGPLERHILNVEEGGHAVVMYNADRKELYLYSHPDQLTLKVDGPAVEEQTQRLTVWNLMFSEKTFFKAGRHTLTLKVR